jgi:hypothetical protein
MLAELFEAYGRTHTERHDKADYRFSQFCKRASKWNFPPLFSLTITKVEILYIFHRFMVSQSYCRRCGNCGKHQKFLQWLIDRVSALTSSPSVHVDVDSRAVTFFDYFPQTSENRLCLDKCCSIYKLVNIYCPWLYNPRYSVLLWERLWITFSCLHKQVFYHTFLPEEHKSDYVIPLLSTFIPWTCVSVCIKHGVICIPSKTVLPSWLWITYNKIVKMGPCKVGEL